MIDLQSVSKSYGREAVVTDVTLRIEPGQCVALLGHNGAGKTTLIKMILGLTRPTAGTISVFGGMAGNSNARRQIGFLPENVAFQRLLTGRETLSYFVRLKKEAETEVGQLLERVGLEGTADRAVSTYSKGMRQRLGLAQALIGSPRLLLLDEPTTGLDPMLRRSFYQIIDTLKEEGASIVLSSHVLSELESRTDRVAIMRQGELVADGNMATLRAKAALPVKIRLKTDAVDHVLQSVGGRRINGCALEINCQLDEKITLLRKLTELPVVIDDVDLTQPSLDEIYAHYGGLEERKP